MFDEGLMARAQTLVDRCIAEHITIATAESCTGGLLSALLTEIAGSSAVFLEGVASYSNIAKTRLLGVDPILIGERGAVSAEVARAMAEGSRARAGSRLAVSVTGVAGPGGGTEDKPVGLVHFALARRNAATRHVERRFGPLSRRAIRLASVDQALAMLEDALAS